MGLLIGRNIGLGAMIKLNEESESITHLDVLASPTRAKMSFFEIR